MTTSVIATPEMVAYCFDSIIGVLNDNYGVPKAPESIPFVKTPLFVTWKKGNRRELCGCIGTFSHDNVLPVALNEYAKTSAFRDNRFNPISLAEVPSLFCGVSLLVNFEKAKDYRDWTIGKHGIHIHFKYNGRRLSSVYLPEVALEQGWNHVQTIDHLLRKGGFEGPINERERQDITIERFQSSKLTLSYDEYRALKQKRKH